MSFFAVGKASGGGIRLGADGLLDGLPAQAGGPNSGSQQTQGPHQDGFSNVHGYERCDAREGCKFVSLARITPPNPRFKSTSSNKKGSRTNREPEELENEAEDLVRALRKQGNQHHQVRQGKQPLVGGQAGGFRGASDKPEVAALGKIVEVIHADASERRHFRIGEDFLTRFYGNHIGLDLSVGLLPITSMLNSWYRLHRILSNSRSVL